MFWRILTLSLSALIAAVAISSAASGDTLRSDAESAMKRLVEFYEQRISLLESENASLRAQLVAAGKTPLIATGSTATGSSTNTTPVTPTIPAVVSGARDAQLMNKVLLSVDDIISDNQLSESIQFAAIEIVEKSATRSISGAVFVDFADNTQPSTGVSAFRYKLLYEYDSSYRLALKGFFEIDSSSNRYITRAGSNPYGGTTRTKVIAPTYKGKIADSTYQAIDLTTGKLSAQQTNATVTTPTTWSDTTTTTPATSTGTGTSAYTRAQVIEYSNANANQALEIVKRATSYLGANPNDIDILLIRAKSYYVMGRSADSIKDFDKIDSLGKLDRSGACFAQRVASSAGNTSKADYFGKTCRLE